MISTKCSDIFPPDWEMLRRSRRVLIFLETTRSLVFEEKSERVFQDALPGQTCFKENLNASRLSEHPPVRGENVKTFRWDHRL